MGLRKGQTNNLKGKPKGAINKLNKDLRKSLSEFLNENFDEVINEWKKLSGRDKVNFYRDLLQYEVPKLSTIQTPDIKKTEPIETIITFKDFSKESESKE